MRRLHWLFVLGSVVLVVVVAVLWRACSGWGPAGDSAPGAEGIELVSPDIALRLLEVRHEPRDTYTDWACIFSCAERAGCGANVQVTIRYATPEGEGSLTMAGRLEGASGERMRVGRVQREMTDVRRVDSVTVEVTATRRPDAPPPTPMM
jgi:hypothetical protein